MFELEESAYIIYGGLQVYGSLGAQEKQLSNNQDPDPYDFRYKNPLYGYT
jgi:hypothetical protein